MKYQLILTLLFLIVGVACAQQSVNTSTNEPNPSDQFDPLKPNPHDLLTKFEEIKTKAEQGDVEAQYSLAFDLENRTLLESKTNVIANINEAVKWYRKSAEQGNILSQEKLAGILRYGAPFGGILPLLTNIVERNPSEAAKWYLCAAKQGDTFSQYSIGDMYEKGEGVVKNYAEAVKWYRGAANQGDSGAQGSLGFKYWKGEGVPQDFVEAYKWFNLASAQNFSDAQKYRDSVAQEMTSEQIAEAQELSRKFIPREEGSNSSTSSENPVASGTGFFITDDGYLISNFHVVKDAARVQLRTGAGLIPAKVVRTDAANDIALLKVEGKFSCLPIAASRAAGLGDSVFTLGFPDPGLQGFAPKLAKGEIASLSGAADDARYFQVSVPVQPGNSGGALVDERGNVIGIVSAKLDASVALAASGALPENVNYAVKSSFLLSFLESAPDVSAKLKSANTTDEKFSDAVNDVKKATVLVLVY
ncbi:MAG TPA: tetratricopeptide repeat-containing serine protease family protein [Methylomirabilota bacterium]|nr:tetratricopeptide repeat-containing serine protease family protein [Methylomirabilota bacterium]